MVSAKLEKLVRQSGLWDGRQRHTHSFLLSPDVFVLPRVRRKELDEFSKSLLEVLAGIGRIVAIAHNPKLGRGITWKKLGKIFQTGAPKVYREIQALNPSQTSALCKVDFVESVDGDLYIVEIDGFNKHGFGYATLAAKIRDVLRKDGERLPGIVATIAKAGESLTVVCANQERFYRPELEVLRRALSACDIRLRVISEFELKTLEDRLFLDLPPMNQNKGAWNLLASAYQQGDVDFLIPPKPFLSSKALMALIRNEAENREVENILCSQIPRIHLQRVRSYVPETWLVEQRMRDHLLSLSGRFVLKEVFSSGTKGVCFSDEPSFRKRFDAACTSSKFNFVLQREIPGAQRTFRYFREEKLEEANWYTRITVHCTFRQAAELTVTACQGKLVHGQPDALHLGSVFL